MRTAVLLLVTSLSLPALASEPCWFTPKGADEEVRFERCILTSKDGDTTIARKVARRIDFRSGPAAVVRTAHGFYYVNRALLARQTVLFDNGPDYFEEGLARTVRNGKTGWFDESLRIVIEPQFDFGFPFENGLAIVCNGCKPEMHGEHALMTGGKWGAIDRTGKVVHPVELDRDEIYRRVAK